MITQRHDIEGMDGFTECRKPMPEKKRPQKDSSYARICPHNEGVLCEKMQCSKCGWNPKVMESRRERNGKP